MRYLGLIVSFFLVAFGQPYFNKGLAVVGALLGFGIFFHALLQFKRRFLVASLWFTAVQLIDLIWFCTPKYHGPMIILVWVLISLWLGVQFGAIKWCLPNQGKPQVKHALAAASFCTLTEFARYFVFCGFAFNPAGLPWTASLYSLQCVSFFGILGFTFWTIFLGVIFAAGKRHLFLASAALPFLLGALLYYPRKRGAEREKESLKALLVQTGLKQEQKMPMPGFYSSFIPPIEQWQHLLSLIPKDQEFDLVVLPEAAFPYGAHQVIFPNQETNGDYARELRRFLGADLLVGLDDSDEKGNHNAAFFFTEKERERYEKRVLVPLGEYLPFAGLRKLAAKYGLTQFFTEGREAKVFYGRVPLSPTICYEECYPHLVRQGRRKGAELFVNITNDGFYPDSILPKVHFAHGLVRSVENGVPVLRSCNTGVTAAVDSLGRVQGKIEGEWEKRGLVTQVPMFTYQTLYSRFGDYPLLFFSLIILLFLQLNSKRDKLDHC
ncbi:MAG: apolipoprotein N-acyltransferase [Candidatus Algichlamydia australiensis]|nr:apolipoprotein N-acyltransferase [Chlamydiales bacterium]